MRATWRPPRRARHRFAKEDRKRFADIIRRHAGRALLHELLAAALVAYTDDPFRPPRGPGRSCRGGRVRRRHGPTLYMGERVCSGRACKEGLWCALR